MIAKYCPELSFTKASTRVAISGSGNVAQFTALKLIELGATVLSLSDSRGALIAKEGFTKQDVETIAELKLKGGSLESLLGDSNFAGRFDYHAGASQGYVCVQSRSDGSVAGKRPWGLIEKVDIALPSATQNEIDATDAELLINAGVRIVAEGSNMGTTQDAVHIFERSRREKGVWYAPGKASNVGGVAVSGLEMAQNSQRLTWSREEVDARLRQIMTDCYNICLDAGSKWGDATHEEGVMPSLLAGANVAGFIKVADAMRLQGDWW
jgi:glutamate dehydrogenase (NADP+)